jgi:hypothetical protein
MKKIFIILFLFSCSKDIYNRDRESIDITITGLNGHTYHWTDYSDKNLDGQYVFNGNNDFLGLYPVCSAMHKGNYYTFNFWHYSSLGLDQISFGTPVVSGSFVNPNANVADPPNLITIRGVNFPLDSVAVTIGNNNVSMTAKYDSALITVSGSYNNLGLY